jgi:hypothetical protein
MAVAMLSFGSRITNGASSRSITSWKRRPSSPAHRSSIPCDRYSFRC